MQDMETLRTQEQNLRSYEARLRAQTHTASSNNCSSPAPTSTISHELEEARHKLARLQALVEAERRALNDERMAFREKQTELARQEEELKKRAAWVEIRERDLAAKAMPPPPNARTKSSAFSSLTQAPFAAARQLLLSNSKRPVA